MTALTFTSESFTLSIEVLPIKFSLEQVASLGVRTGVGLGVTAGVGVGVTAGVGVGVGLNEHDGDRAPPLVAVETPLPSLSVHTVTKTEYRITQLALVN